MRLVKTPFILKKLFPNVIWSKSDIEKTVYLTFDDGPTPKITEWVLNELNKHHAKATFFCLGKNVIKHPEILQKIIEYGHKVGNHTFNHSNAWKVSNADFLKDVEACKKVLKTDLFRPPYGKITPQLINTLNKDFKIVLWNVLSYDFDKNITPTQCYKFVTQNIENGSIIVFHDSKKAFKNLEVVLPKVLNFLKENGYKMSGL